MAQVLNNPIVINGGGGAPSPVIVSEDHGLIWNGKCRIRYFDIDGTLLKLEYVKKDTYTSPPTHPNYDPEYLVFAEWNYDTAVAIKQPMDIGATYNTVDGRTYIFINVNQFTGYDADLQVQAIQVDWGDGTIDDQLTHTYVADGHYIIKLIQNDESLWPTTKGLITNLGSGSGAGDQGLDSAIYKIYVGSGGWGNIGATFRYCRNLNIVSLPPKDFQPQHGNETSIRDCYFLQAFIVPRNWPLNIAIGSNYYIKAISRPTSSNINYSGYAHASGDICCEYIESYGVTKLSNFNARYDIVYIPETVVEISQVSIMPWTPIIIINTPSVPKISLSSSIFQPNTQLIIYVRDELVDQYKNATNWSLLGNRFKPLSTSPYNF